MFSTLQETKGDVAFKMEDVTAGRRKFETAKVHTRHNNINNNCVNCNAVLQFGMT